MLPPKRSAVRLSLLACLLSLLSACSNSKVLESWFAADPKLKENPVTMSSPPETQQNQTQNQLPDDFPPEIPIYPEAQLLNVESTPSRRGKTLWTASDSSDAIASFYQEEFQSNDWQLDTPSSQGEDELSQSGSNAVSDWVVRRDGLQVRVTISSQPDGEETTSPSASQDSSKDTTFVIEYQRDSNFAQFDTEESNQTQIASESALEFSDLDKAPEQLRQYVEDLAALGVLTSDLAGNKSPEATKPLNRINR